MSGKGLIRSCGCFCKDTVWAKGSKSPHWKGGKKPDYRKSWLLRKYNITKSDYGQILSEQKGVCAICGNSQKRRKLAVDHNHATGKIRGIL